MYCTLYTAIKLLLVHSATTSYVLYLVSNEYAILLGFTDRRIGNQLFSDGLRGYILTVSNDALDRRRCNPQADRRRVC